MEDELELPVALEKTLPQRYINVSQELSKLAAEKETFARVHHHFRSASLGYKPLGKDSFKLKVRPTKYPVFGSFTGTVHIYEDVQERLYRIEGMLQYRMSIIWFIGVLAFFFLFVYISKPGFWEGTLFEALGAGLCLYWTYQLGQQERDAVDERVHASLLQLRTSFENLR